VAFSLDKIVTCHPQFLKDDRLIYGWREIENREISRHSRAEGRWESLRIIEYYYEIPDALRAGDDSFRLFCEFRASG
jgi:hypothetical protein